MLLSLSPVKKEFNHVVLMYRDFFLLQNICTIIRRGSKRGDLYYVDEMTQQGHNMLAHGTVAQQLWLWQRRLVHPSFGYLKSLCSSFFNNNPTIPPCETCILPKQHRTTFWPDNTHVGNMFSLIHSDVWGPAPCPTPYDFQYFMIFVYDFPHDLGIFLKTQIWCPY